MGKAAATHSDYILVQSVESLTGEHLVSDVPLKPQR